MYEYRLVMRPIVWDKKEVKRCPFCGKKDDVWVVRYEKNDKMMFATRCIGCGMTLDNGSCKTQWEALENWNKRSSWA